MTERNPQRWRALAVCLVAGFMVLLDVSIVNVALPTIRSGLHASASELQWVLSGYSLAFGLMLVPAGRFGDMRGRRGVFIAALIGFVVASAACGAAQNSGWLVTARLVQGLAGGALTPQVSAFIQQMFAGDERGKAFGWYGSVIGVSTAVGPLLGGLLIAGFGTSEGWRYVFYVNVPIGLVAVPFAWRLLPAKTPGGERRHDFDPVGIALLAVSAVVLLLPFVQDRVWTGPQKWLLVPAALALVAVFLWWERRYARVGHEPVVDLALFQRRSYAFGVSMITLYFAAFTPLFFILTLFLQTGLHYSALLAGLSVTPFAAGSAMMASLGGRRAMRYGRALVTLGLSMVTVGIGGAALAVRLVPGHHAGWATLGPLLLAGLGSGLVIAPNQTLTLAEVPVEQAGTAGGLLQTAQRIGAAVGVAAVGAVFFGAAAGHGYAAAFERSALVSVAFVLCAVAITVVDIVVDRRLAHDEEPAREPSRSSA